MVFFDKFCPDLHDLPNGSDVGDSGICGSDSTSDTTSGTTTTGAKRGITSGISSLAGTGDAEHVSSPSNATASTSSFSSLLAACRWCGVELGNRSVIILSDDNNNHDKNDGHAGGEGFPGDDQAVGGAGMEEGSGGDGGVVVLGLHGFLRRFVDGSGAEDLARRGDLLRKTHLSSKVRCRFAFNNWSSCWVCLFCLF